MDHSKKPEEIDRRPPAGPDAETLDACRRGDPKALERVFRAEIPALERVLARLLGPDPEREDVLQQVLLAAMTAFPRYRGDASVRTWLTGIAVHVVREHWRRPGRRRVPLEVVGESPDPRAAGATGAAQADRREGIRRLYEHLESLSPKKRIAFVLHVLEGRPVAEVAALMDASVSATKSRIFFARRELIRRARRDPVLSSMITAKEP